MGLGVHHAGDCPRLDPRAFPIAHDSHGHRMLDKLARHGLESEEAAFGLKCKINEEIGMAFQLRLVNAHVALHFPSLVDLGLVFMGGAAAVLRMLPVFLAYGVRPGLRLCNQRGVCNSRRLKLIVLPRRIYIRGLPIFVERARPFKCLSDERRTTSVMGYMVHKIFW